MAAAASAMVGIVLIGRRSVEKVVEGSASGAGAGVRTSRCIASMPPHAAWMPALCAGVSGMPARATNASNSSSVVSGGIGTPPASDDAVQYGGDSPNREATSGSRGKPPGCVRCATEARLAKETDADRDTGRA